MEKPKEKGFSINPEQVAEEILNCPIEALEDKLVIMPYEPERKTKSGIITPYNNEPSNKQIPLGFVLNVGPKAQDTGLKAGDLIQWAGSCQSAMLNGKEYLIFQKLWLLSKVDISKIETWA